MWLGCWRAGTKIAAWIADRLRDDLAGRDIDIKREVEVRVAVRADIHVDALALEHVEGTRQVTVIAAVKGCWNRELRTAMRTQLAGRYLSARIPRHLPRRVVRARRLGGRRRPSSASCARLPCDRLLGRLADRCCGSGCEREL
jgi:hypothetical protein